MTDLHALADPFQGTASDPDYSVGNTLPLVARPFGMHHWSLQTAKGPWFFHPAHQKAWGIRLTHQPSPWMGDYASLLLIPFRGPVLDDPAHQAGAHVLEECRPAGLRFRSLRYDLRCEMAPTERGAVFVISGLGESDAPLRFRLRFDSTKGGPHELHGKDGKAVFSGVSRDQTFAAPEGYGLHFHGVFDVAPESFDVLPDGGVWTFPRDVGRVTLRLAGSFVGDDVARQTWARELEGRRVEDVRGEGEAAWNALLGRIRFAPRSEAQARTFYSCLYRCLLFPRSLEEIDVAGATIHRSPYDGQVHPGPLCTDNGFWDTHRTLYPLLAYVYPDILKRFLDGWMNACRQGGWTPKWASPGFRACMIGTHFDAVAAEAVARGIVDWDVEGAFKYLWQDATVPGPDGSKGRPDLEDYLRFGYIPSDRGHHHAVSATLDYAYDDFCIGQVARYLGREKEAAEMERRSKFYRNLFDPSVGFMRERLASGAWAGPFREFAWGGGYVEGGPWQHTFNVPHDPRGLAALFGGNEGLCRKLDRMLSLPPTFEAGAYGFEIHEMTEMAQAGFGQYAQSNQPVHGFLFLYALCGEPEKTGHWVRKVASTLYTPSTFPGDEDNGEMAAWYVWATLGLFPQCPGMPGYVRFQGLGDDVRVEGRPAPSEAVGSSLLSSSAATELQPAMAAR